MDLRLLHSWSAGDPHAGERLYDRYFDITYRFFRLKVPHAAQDLTQTTMLALTRSGHRFCGHGSVRSFVLGIANNVFRNYLRSRRRDRLEFNGEELSCEDLGLGPFEFVSDSEDHKLLVKALRRIPIHLQTVIELTYWEEMNSKEVSIVLGVPSSTIRARIGRARTLLKAQIQRLTESKDRVESTLIGLRTWAAELRKMIGGPRSERCDSGVRCASAVGSAPP